VSLNLIRLCLTRPVAVSVGVLLVVLFGLLSLFAIPVQLTPNVDVTVVTVQTSWPGASPLEVEQEIIDRQEEMLQSVQGVTDMTSSASDNSATVTLEFSPDVDKDTALRDVTDKLRQVSNYPLQVEQPTVAAADASIDSPIAWLILRNEVDPTGRQTRELRDFADDFIKPYLERVPGVASVSIYGGLEREMKVKVDAGALAARGLTFTQVESALRRQNRNISAGARPQGKRDYTVRTVGQYESPEEVATTVVAYTPGGPVYVRDVAEVELGFKKEGSFVRSKGQYVLAFPVRRETGTNVMKIMADLKVAIGRVNDEVLSSRGLKLDLTQVYDETVYIEQSIDMVRRNIIFGGLLAGVVLMLFLRNWRATLVVGLSIPVSIVGTFLAVRMLGRTINVVSLAGMAFAVGMVVDNAVVVLENIFRHAQMGKRIFDAALDGAREVWGAVLASTLTTMAVFIPVIFVQDEAGQLFRDISVATVAAVGLSLIVSITVIPPLAARLLAPRGERSAGRIPTDESSGRLASWVAAVVDRMNRSNVLRLVVIIGVTVGALALAEPLIPPPTYLPHGNRNLVFGSLLTPPGYSLDEYRRMASMIEEMVAPYWTVEPGSPEKAELDRRWVETIEQRLAAGQIPGLGPDSKLTPAERQRARREWLTPPPAIENFFFVAHGSGCFMGAASADPGRVKPLANLLTTAGSRVPGIMAFFGQAGLFRFSGGNTAEIEIRGDNLEEVVAAATAVQMECFQFGFPQPSPANFNLGRPELQVVPLAERAADVGLDVTDVGLVVEASVDGAFVGDYREQSGRLIDLSLYVKGQQDEPTRAIGDIPLYTPSAGVITLASVVDMRDTTSLEQIRHSQRQRAVVLTVTPPEALALDELIGRITGEIVPRLREQGRIAPGVVVGLTGNADKLVAARNTMVGEWQGFTLASLVNIASSRFFLSVLIVYLLLAALYESWLYPAVIMFSVPLAIFGGFVGLWVAHRATLMSTLQPVQQLDVLTFLGFVILVGIVVNNAILLVSQSLIFVREHGMASHDAIRESVRVRFRPVFMTSLTTFFGQLPLALMPGAGSELYRGLAAVMLGGLLIATIGTLFLVPLVLGLIFDLREFALGRAVKREPGVVPSAEPAMRASAAASRTATVATLAPHPDDPRASEQPALGSSGK
jgi:HAE1 family hydrophobic/amphiphilic exporter-1